jgi:hypothetical protein
MVRVALNFDHPIIFNADFQAAANAAVGTLGGVPLIDGKV